MIKKTIDKNILLKKLSFLGYSDRQKNMAILCRNNKEKEGLSSLLEDFLLQGSAYEGKLALIGAEAARDYSVIILALEHPSISVQLEAVSLLVKVVPNESCNIEEIIENLSYECRKKLLKEIYVYKRQDFAEVLLPIVYSSFGAKEAARLISVCTEETVRKWLPKIEYAIVNWKMLSITYPKIVKERFKANLEKAAYREKIYVWYRFFSAVKELSVTDSDFILNCALNIGPKNVIFSVLKNKLRVLLSRNSNKVYELLVSDECINDLLIRGIPKSILSHGKYLSKEQWINIGKILKDKPYYIKKLLHSVAPSKRGEIFDAIYENNKGKNIIFSEDILHELPNDIRDREAKEAMTFPEVYEDKVKLMNFAAYEYIDNAKKILLKEINSSDVEKRSIAYSRLIRSADLSKKGMGEVLKVLTYIKNDQDLVKCAVFRELSNCSPADFTNENIGELLILTDYAINGMDSSYETLYLVQKFVFKLMQYNGKNKKSEIFNFAMDTIIKIVIKTGELELSSFENNMPKGVEVEFFKKIYPVALEAKNKENYELIVNLAKVFGKRGYKIERLQELIKEVIKGKNEKTSIEAVKYYIKDKKNKDKRVKELLDSDKSYIYVDEVFEYIHRKRQEWLEPFISSKVIKGKFLSGDTIYLVPAEKGFDRWLPEQQKLFASMLESIALSDRYNTNFRVEAIERISKMPDYFENDILTLLKNENIEIVETVLYSLSLIDNKEKAFKVLLENLMGDTAKTAIAALSKCIGSINPKYAPSIIKEILDRDKLKLTVRKELIRILGKYRFKESMFIITDEFNKEKVHKDVLISIGQAVRCFLDDERSWSILKKLSEIDDSEVVLSLLNQSPKEIPLDKRKNYLGVLLKITENKNLEVANLAFVYLENWISIDEQAIAETVSKAIINVKDRSSKWKRSEDILIKADYEGKVDEIIIDVFKRLIDIKIEDVVDIKLIGDLPARQRLIEFSNKLISLPKTISFKFKPLYKEIINILQRDETLKYISIKFYLAFINWNDVEDIINNLEKVEEEIKDQPYYLNKLYMDILERLNFIKAYWNPEIILKVVDELYNKSYELQFMGLALLEAAGEKLSWNHYSINLLKKYRSNINIDIKTKALDIWIINE